MKHLGNPLWNFVYQTTTALMLIASGCSRNNEGSREMSRSEIEAKLNGVLHQMVVRSANEKDREALRNAEIFHDLQGLSMDIVGISVALNSGSNRAHVSYTIDHFRQTRVDVLAAEGLEDMQTAKAHSLQRPDRELNTRVTEPQRGNPYQPGATPQVTEPE